MENKPNRIIWHHSADTSPGPQFDKINEYHKTRGFPLSKLGWYGGYHVLIEKDGTVRRYRTDSEIGAHDSGENVNSLGVCLAGNFSLEKPTERQIFNFRSLLLTWMIQYNIPKDRIDPHRMGDATECPGKLLTDDFARNLVSADEISTNVTEAISLMERALELLDAAR